MVTYIHCCIMADRGWTAVVINIICTSPTARAQQKMYSWYNSHWFRTILSPVPVLHGYKWPDNLKSSYVSYIKFFLYVTLASAQTNSLFLKLEVLHFLEMEHLTTTRCRIPTIIIWLSMVALFLQFNAGMVCWNKLWQLPFKMSHSYNWNCIKGI
jgi:hypothetical protein